MFEFIRKSFFAGLTTLSSVNLLNAIPLNLQIGKIKQIETKNWTYHFYSDIINIEEFDLNMLKIDKKS